MKYLSILFFFISFLNFSQSEQLKKSVALSFDGEKQFAKIPNILPTNFTLEICIKTSKQSAKGVLAYHGSGILDADFSGDANDFTLTILNDFLSFHEGASKVNFIGKQKVTDGKWHHISLTRKSEKEFIIYLDGEIIGRGKAGKLALNASPFIYVATNNGYNSPTKIDIDEIRLWNRVLEEGEIKNNLFSELAENQNGLLSYYTINKHDTLKNKLIDQSGNNNHGELINFNLHEKKNKVNGPFPDGKKAWKYPIYTSPTFLGIVFGILIVLILVFVKIRIRFLKNENEKLEKIVSLRTQDIQKALHEKEILLIEKDVLLQEVHHRIKNNLQQISILVDMQIRNITELAGKNALQEAHRRISSMSLIHEMLYTSENVSQINTKDFISDLIIKHKLAFNYLDKEVEFINEIESYNLSPNDAISVGMILSEAISNSYKHAFKTIENPKIWVLFKEIDSDKFRLIIKDNGIGFNLDENMVNNKSFGIRLLHIFTKKLNGTIELTPNYPGTTLTINFFISKKQN